MSKGFKVKVTDYDREPINYALCKVQRMVAGIVAPVDYVQRRTDSQGRCDLYFEGINWWYRVKVTAQDYETGYSITYFLTGDETKGSDENPVYIRLRYLGGTGGEDCPDEEYYCPYDEDHGYWCSESELNAHIRQEHSEDPPPEGEYYCPYCDEKFDSYEKLEEHISLEHKCTIAEFQKIMAGECECFIATAALGTEVYEHLDVLRQVRDEMLSNRVLKYIIKIYYKLSPYPSKLLIYSKRIKRIIKIGVKGLIGIVRRKL